MSSIRDLLKNGKVSACERVIYRVKQDSSKIREVIQALQDGDEDIRRCAAEILDEIRDERSVEPLIKALSDKSWKVRGPAAKALGTIGDSRALTPLIKVLKNDVKSSVRGNAAWALGHIRPVVVDVVPILMRALEDKDWYVRSSATIALGSIGPVTDEVVPSLMKALGDNEDLVRRSALSALGTIGPAAAEAVPALEKVLRNWRIDEYRRWLAARALGNIGYPEAAMAVPALERAQRDRDKDVRKGAAEALRKIKSSAPNVKELVEMKDVDRLIETALKHWDHSVRYEAARESGRIGGKHAVEQLCKALESENLGRRAMEALEEIGEPAVERLIKTLKEEDGRYRAAHALGVIGDKRAVPALIESLKDESRDVGGIAAAALGMIGDKRAIEPLARVLGASDDQWMREKVTIALGRLGDKRVLEPLLKEFETEVSRRWESEVSDRRKIAEALGNIGDKRAIELLTKALKDDDEGVRKAAKEALQKIQNKLQ